MHIIRAHEASDTDGVVRLSLRAWRPVFASLEQALGDELFARFHPDWRAGQQQAVEAACTDEQVSVWVAEEASAIVGFVALEFDHTSHVGEIHMIAVDPDHQGRGLATDLTRFALEQFAAGGMAIAMVETGGDPGHAPARATYERAGFTLLPIARYFKPL